MFGTYLRAAAALGGAVLVAKLIEWLVPMLVPYMGETIVARSFESLANNALLIALIAIAVGVIARAVNESDPARMR